MAETGLQHLVTCRCVLPQFKRRPNPPRHQFVVFSIIVDDVVKPKFSQCNNCGLVHRVTEVNRSDIMSGREELRSIASIDDVKVGLPPQLVGLLDANNAGLSVWEAAKHVYDGKRWGDHVVLTTDADAGMTFGKYVVIIGEALFKVETFEREETTS